MGNNTDRKLATVRRIAAIKEHTNADTLELAVVDGWQVVVRKDEFKAGDLVVYFEVDSILPVRDEFEFLRKSSYVKRDWVEGFRLKTIRLRGQLSQGLVVPVKQDANESYITVTDPESGVDDYVTVNEGDDVTDFLGVVKWDPPLPAALAGEVKGWFPTFIPKTDQERIQNLVSELAEASAVGDEFEVTIKLDGTSCTMYVKDEEVGVCSRNLELKINDANENNSLVRMLIDSGLYDALGRDRRNIALQGELMGPGIGGNREKFGEFRFYLYDIYDIDAQRYLTPTERIEFELDGFKNVYHVPSLGFKVPFATVDEMLAANEGPSINNPVREGTVWKRDDGKFSFKIISNTFLIQEK